MRFGIVPVLAMAMLIIFLGFLWTSVQMVHPSTPRPLSTQLSLASSQISIKPTRFVDVKTPRSTMSTTSAPTNGDGSDSEIGQCGWPYRGQPKSIKQIHHGIYKTVFENDFIVAFKTECRPASKWHGQQGWSEVGVYAMARLMFPETKYDVPCAQGMRLTFTPEQINEMHKDRCGVVKPGSSEVVGVALEWIPRHDDGGLPAKTFAKGFSGDIPFITQHKETLSQISDILVFDYIDGNTDREDKNWFFSKDHKYIPMDNGWAFSGGNIFEESVCEIHSETLRCPPLFKYLTGSTRCDGVQNCVFRKQTIEAFQNISTRWESELSPTWEKAMEDDILVKYLIDNFDSDRPLRKKRQYSTALARFINSCEPTQNLITMVSQGIAARLKALQKHVAQCIKKKGGDSLVLL
eukprot:PhF_6_TR7352/c0_g1_i1/m.11051